MFTYLIQQIFPLSNQLIDCSGTEIFRHKMLIVCLHSLSDVMTNYVLAVYHIGSKTGTTYVGHKRQYTRK